MLLKKTTIYFAFFKHTSTFYNCSCFHFLRRYFEFPAALLLSILERCAWVHFKHWEVSSTGSQGCILHFAVGHLCHLCCGSVHFWGVGWKCAFFGGRLEVYIFRVIWPHTGFRLGKPVNFRICNISWIRNWFKAVQSDTRYICLIIMRNRANQQLSRKEYAHISAGGFQKSS